MYYFTASRYSAQITSLYFVKVAELLFVSEDVIIGLPTLLLNMR